MTRRISIPILTGVAAVALVALAAAGCGGGGNGASETSAPSASAGAQSAALTTADDDALGTILVDSSGRTLYLFEKDAGTKSACSGACAALWPPLQRSGADTVGGAATASLVDATIRSDGERQVTYGGHPVYLYAGDDEPGDTEGQGLTDFGGSWYAINGAGDEVTAESDSSSETASGYSETASGY